MEWKGKRGKGKNHPPPKKGCVIKQIPPRAIGLYFFEVLGGENSHLRVILLRDEGVGFLYNNFNQPLFPDLLGVMN